MIQTTNLTETQVNTINLICSLNPAFNRENLELLVAKTSQLGGCTIINIKDFSSQKTDFTEIASHRVNIGGAYAPMVEKSRKSYETVTKMDFARRLLKHNYNKYVITDLKEFQRQVLAAFDVALTELKNPVKRDTPSNDIWLNKVLVFNTNTLNLAIMGQSLNKTVTQEGEKKQTKSAPKTVAKAIINEVCKPSTDKLRRFPVGQLEVVRMQGEEMEIAGVE